MTTCRTCAHLDAPRDKNGRRMVRKGNAYRCTAPMPIVLGVPLCFDEIRAALNREHRRFVVADQTGCPAHQAITKVEP